MTFFPAEAPQGGLMTREFSKDERSLLEAAVTLTRRLDVRETCAAVLRAAEQLFAARSSWVLVHDPQADCLMTVAARGPAAEAYAGVRIPSRHGIAALSFHERRAVFVAIGTRDPQADNDAREDEEGGHQPPIDPP